MTLPLWPPSICTIRKLMPDHLPFVVEPMTLADLGQVMAIEQAVFPAPWPESAFRHEITNNEYGTMLVVRSAHESNSPVLGYIGLWLLVDDAHVANLAVDPRFQGQGLGELLLLSLLDRAMKAGACRATLEVRVSNRVAQNLYQKYGFDIITRCTQYYASDNEDGYVMATPALNSRRFQDNLMRRRTALYAHLRDRERSWAIR